jgi:hypothetical protein
MGRQIVQESFMSKVTNLKIRIYLLFPSKTRIQPVVDPDNKR